MIAVADSLKLDNLITSGSSMGGATALYTAINFPDRVKGVIMIRPPTAWDERLHRRHNLLSSAEKCRRTHPNEKYHFVLSGAAQSDLPPLENIEIYNKIQCPVLLLALKGDDKHPVSTALNLSKVLRSNELHIANSEEEAKASWPSIISSFISRISH